MIVVRSANTGEVVRELEPKVLHCREWGLILGAPILVMGLLPSFRSVRIVNLIALVGTNYSCLYFFVWGVSKGITPGIFTRCVSIARSMPLIAQLCA